MNTEYVVVGGGEWGCYHTERLLRAMTNGRLAPATVRIVDRNASCRAFELYGEVAGVRFSVAEWAPFLLGWLDERAAGSGSHIVPSPHAPHLFLEWLEMFLASRRPTAALRREPFQAELNLPFQYPDAAGSLYLSVASWECPLSCREPAVCPAIRARRSWELGDIIRNRSASPAASMTPLIWKSEYICPGVAGVSARAMLRGAHDLLAGGATGKAAVATVSACHGVVSVLSYDLAPERSTCV